MTHDREKLRQLAERADKAGWTLDTDGDLCARVPTCWREDAWQDEQGRANAAFVVAAQPAAVLSLLDEIERVEAEALQLETQAEELRNAPWPQWTNDCLKLIRDESGYDGYDDADGVDLPEELSELINELRHQADKNVAEARASRKLDEAERTAEHYRVQAKGYRDEITQLKADLAEAREALKLSESAMREYYRYWTGGETRGSYDGKPERNAMWEAMRRAASVHSRLSGEG